MESLEKEFVPYAEAFELKSLGFDEPCFAFWDAYNGGTHLLFKPRTSYHWMVRLYNALKGIDSKTVLDYSAGLLEHEEGDNAVLAPTYSQAFRWFRDYHHWPIESWIQPYLSEKPRQYEGLYWTRGEKVSVGVFSTHGEAELACLRKLIEIVKKRQST